jgi:hypothetical protein
VAVSRTLKTVTGAHRRAFSWKTGVPPCRSKQQPGRLFPLTIKTDVFLRFASRQSIAAEAVSRSKIRRRDWQQLDYFFAFGDRSASRFST